ncbi:hypothetical protein AB1Y20_009598 [Prymnesium parvum]|uniref:Saccharopine dehydrogenase NADP binding domain-containing protein n=1 Tax=Prymnesium parvum TaxID=97485 RepID=A0AB34K223_PRYPA
MTAALWLRLLAALAVARPAAAARVLLLGGSGRIGSSCAAHLLQRDPSVELLLGGRDAARGARAAASLGAQFPGARVSFAQLDWTDEAQLQALIGATSPTAVVHTAGPYNQAEPVVLRATIQSGVPVYVDLSDPLAYIDAALAMRDEAAAAGTTALLCAGAFPGLSNLMAMECAARMGDDATIQDLQFSYFTAGLGGSGEVNLLITNEGFGDPVPTFRDGKLSPQLIGGLDSRRVKFFLEPSEPSASLVGEREVWAWPFPEAATVARQLSIRGDSSVRMGTAPALWNSVLGFFVSVVPRSWWRSRAFSNGLAQFSRPLVKVTDAFVGETHAMRIDVTNSEGALVSAVQAHRSFRGIVGQSCAEFTLALLDDCGAGDAGAASSSLPAGVFTPEALFESASRRAPLLDRMLAVDGTLNYAFRGPA